MNRKIQLLEVSAFLLLVAPSLVLSFFATLQGHEGFRVTVVTVTPCHLTLVSLILFFIWRNGRGD